MVLTQGRHPRWSSELRCRGLYADVPIFCLQNLGAGKFSVRCFYLEKNLVFLALGFRGFGSEECRVPEAGVTLGGIAPQLSAACTVYARWNYHGNGTRHVRGHGIA